MIRNYYNRENISLRDKIFSLDYYLILLVILLGIISFFAMYSTERGNFDYYTKSHIYRFCIFFILFIAFSFFSIRFWHKLSYIFYFTALILLIGVDFLELPLQDQSVGLIYFL